MMKAVSGYSVNSVSNMINAIQEQTGTPQNPVDWSEPDMWINERLKGEDAGSRCGSGIRITTSSIRAIVTVAICF